MVEKGKKYWFLFLLILFDLSFIQCHNTSEMCIQPLKYDEWNKL